LTDASLSGRQGTRMWIFSCKFVFSCKHARFIKVYLPKKERMKQKIAIIGAGNLGTRISLELHNQGAEIIQVYSRTITSALTLGRLVGCSYVTAPEKITTEADIYLVSVSDSVIEELLKKIQFNNKLIVHTAGSVDMEVLKPFSENYGVLYPLQTFSKFRAVDFSVIPFCIEANNAENQQKLVDLASLISKDVRIINSEQRKQLHLAAIFANNFVNHLLAVADEIVGEKKLPFSILQPLINETIAKAQYLSPKEAQTGPAVRNDQNTINEHLNMLRNDPQRAALYRILSENIYEFQKK